MPDEQSTSHYVKNARVRKDASGDYWLFIEAGDLKAGFKLSSGAGADEDSIERRTLAAWIAEQDKGNGEG